MDLILGVSALDRLILFVQQALCNLVARHFSLILTLSFGLLHLSRLVALSLCHRLHQLLCVESVVLGLIYRGSDTSTRWNEQSRLAKPVVC